MLIVTAILAYLLGAVPFGIVMARVFRLGDLRQIGSGNIGATNVLRTGNKLAAFLTLVCDAGKGALAVIVTRAMAGPEAAEMAGVAAFLGHCYPIYLGFRGGKGVATFLGTALALVWPVGLAACGVWLVSAAIFRISSLAALMAAISAPIVAALMGYGGLFLPLSGMALLIVLRHRLNISRLVRGEEPKIGRKS